MASFLDLFLWALFDYDLNDGYEDSPAPLVVVKGIEASSPKRDGVKELPKNTMREKTDLTDQEVDDLIKSIEKRSRYERR